MNHPDTLAPRPLCGACSEYPVADAIDTCGVCALAMLLGVTYENQGWRATLWGNYYLNMLDSNSIANNGNCLDEVNDKWQPNFHVGGTQTYEVRRGAHTIGVFDSLAAAETVAAALVGETAAAPAAAEPEPEPEPEPVRARRR